MGSAVWQEEILNLSISPQGKLFFLHEGQSEVLDFTLKAIEDELELNLKMYNASVRLIEDIPTVLACVVIHFVFNY